MKLKKNFIIIIPSLSNNRYSSYGDLHPWGGSTLLEWKISQLKQVNEIDKILKARQPETSSSKNQSSSTEDSILRQIKK